MFTATRSGSIDVVLTAKRQLRGRACERELETEEPMRGADYRLV